MGSVLCVLVFFGKQFEKIFENSKKAGNSAEKREFFNEKSSYSF